MKTVAHNQTMQEMLDSIRGSKKIENGEVNFDRKDLELSLHRSGLTLEMADRYDDHGNNYAAAAAQIAAELSQGNFEDDAACEEMNMSVYLSPTQSMVGNFKRRHTIDNTEYGNHMTARHEIRNDNLDQVRNLSYEAGKKLLGSG